MNPLLEGIKGIIFDYGGTIDTRGDHWSHILEKGWHTAGINAPLDVFRHCYATAERTLARQRIVLPQDNFHTLLLKKARLQLQFLQQTHPALCPTNPPQAATTIAAYCNGYAAGCITRALPVLQALARQYPMVLVSNFYGNVDQVLRSYSLRHLFQGIIESAVVGVRKPDPRIFALGVTALGLEPHQVLVVGDSLKKDILPARSLGCRTAWIKGRGWTPDEDLHSDPAQIPSLAALMP